MLNNLTILIFLINFTLESIQKYRIINWLENGKIFDLFFLLYFLQILFV